MSDEKLIRAINSLNKSEVDKLLGSNNLEDFMIAKSMKLSPQALIFLRDNYDVTLKNIFSRTDITVGQMQILLQNGYKPSKHMILTYSGYFDLSLFKMLFVYGVKIPEEVVWKWDSTVYSNALMFYLEHGGNPNIRPLVIHCRTIGKYQRSLIDKWIMQQDDENRTKEDIEIINHTVNSLIKHGAKKSPYAMTKKELDAYYLLQLNDPHRFKQEQLQKIKEIQHLMNSTSDEAELAEYASAIESFKLDISLCN